MTTTYERGPVEVADRVWAYLQPDGGWGWSNAGLVEGGGTSLLVDTLFDLKLTRQMLDDLGRVSSSPITAVVNTHANGDHCYGNSLIPAAEIIASTRCRDEMAELPPSRLAEMMRAAPNLGAAGEFMQRIFSPFDFDDNELALPTRTFDERLSLPVGDRTAELVEVGPAHTAGDVVVHLPVEGVVFTGDILFHGGHPIVWAGPVSNWIDACDAILALNPTTVVPGHGPLATPQAVVDMRDYFIWLMAESKLRYEAGLDPLAAAFDMGGGPYAGWGESERLAVNVAAAYRDLGAEVETDVVTSFSNMAALAF